MIRKIAIGLVALWFLIDVFLVLSALKGLNDYTVAFALIPGLGDGAMLASLLRVMVHDTYDDAQEKILYMYFMVSRCLVFLVTFGFAFSEPRLWPLFLLSLVSIWTVVLARSRKLPRSSWSGFPSVLKGLGIFLLFVILMMLLSALNNLRMR